MKTKIDILFGIAHYGVDPKVTMRAVLRKEGALYKKGNLAGALLIKPRFEIKHYETFQLIVAQQGKLDEFDNACSKARGTVSFILSDMPAECIKAKRKDGTFYYAIIINLGSEAHPHPRAFYLNDMHEALIKSKAFKPQAEFTLTEELDLDEIEEDEEDNE